MKKKFRYILGFSALFVFLCNSCAKNRSAPSEEILSVDSTLIRGPNDSTSYFKSSGLLTNDKFIFVIDKSNREVLKFNKKGDFLSKWGKKGKGPCELDKPLFGDLRYGWMAIPDLDANKIILIREDFSECKEILVKEGRPFDVSFDNNRNLVVQLYRPNGVIFETYSLNKELLNRFFQVNPDDTALLNAGTLTVDGNNNLIFAYRYKNLVQIYDSAGRLKKSFNLPFLTNEIKLSTIGTPQNTFIQNVEFDPTNEEILFLKGGIYSDIKSYIYLFDLSYSYLYSVDVELSSGIIESGSSSNFYITGGFESEIWEISKNKRYGNN
ncbi:6-bladed beta-propeller [Fodinibius halophilus]|uniref:6-bladed beta-propeller n=1 Tax=Fodinibius halophilus TaxID=1736908 RepID=A0A6M1T6I8_9BACT|nr:6-bladed beta-propeller [Fodinibius halophilus]NGP87631.1 hypothetical protein [Fodinibius halophilus]